MKPNLAGFAAAQRSLIDNFGRDVRFYRHAEMTYDPSIPMSGFDDEGIPLDPLKDGTPVNPADVEIANLTLKGTIRAQVVFRPLQTSILRRDETFETPLGIRSGLNKDLLLRPEDIGITDGASHFQVGSTADDGTWTPESSTLWQIVNVEADSFGSVERVIVYGESTR